MNAVYPWIPLISPEVLLLEQAPGVVDVRQEIGYFLVRLDTRHDVIIAEHGCPIHPPGDPFENHLPVAFYTPHRDVVRLGHELRVAVEQAKVNGGITLVDPTFDPNATPRMRSPEPRDARACARYMRAKALSALALGLQCVFCGEDSEGFDHLVPRYRGGLDAAANLVPACSDCNVAKDAKSIDDFLDLAELASPGFCLGVLTRIYKRGILPPS